MMKWTENDRLQLVEAVIKVEQEMLSEWKNASCQHSAGEPRVGKWNFSRNSTEKWDAIADLLPPKFGEKYWNHRRQRYNLPKCKAMFHNLLKSYRDKVGGKPTRHSQWRLSAPVLEIFKRREDLLNVRCSVPDKNFSRSVLTKQVDVEVDASRSVHRDANRPKKQISPTGNSSDTSSLNMGTTPKRINWGEVSRLQVLQAVIKVEKEIRKEKNGERPYSTGNQKNKWNRIADLLPPGLRERVWDSGKQRLGADYKCGRLFHNLLRSYRDKLAGKASRASRSCAMSENVLKLMKKREQLWNAGYVTLQSEKRSSVSGRSKSVSTGEISRHDEHQLSRTSSSSSKGQLSMSSVSDEGAAWSLEDPDQLESSEEAPKFENEVEGEEGTHAGQDESSGKGTSQVSSARASRSVGESEHMRYQTTVPASRNCAPNAARSGARSWSALKSKAQTRAGSRDPAYGTTRRSTKRQASLSKRKCNVNADIHGTSFDENKVHTKTMQRSLMRTESEFSSLSSWVHNQLIPVGQNFVSEIIRSEIRSGKRPKLSVHRPGTVTGNGDLEPNRRSRRRMIDKQIQASFHELRIQFVQELDEVLEEAGFLNMVCRSPHPSRETPLSSPINAMPANGSK